MALDIVCRSCGASNYETNDADGFMTGLDGTIIPSPRVKKFDPDRTACGSMFHLKEFYRNQMWSHFPYESNAVYDVLECAECGAPLPGLDGKVKTRPQNGNGIVKETGNSARPAKPEEAEGFPPFPSASGHTSESEPPHYTLADFLSAKPDDPWYFEGCGCEKTRSATTMEMGFCDECRMERDKTAVRKKK